MWLALGIEIVPQILFPIAVTESLNAYFFATQPFAQQEIA